MAALTSSIWSGQGLTASAILLLLVGLLSWLAQDAIKSLMFHPLSRFPGPRLAAITTYRKAYIELVVQRSWHIELEILHRRYGTWGLSVVLCPRKRRTGWFVRGQLLGKMCLRNSAIGPVVRVASNELHFSDPQAYLDIYNNSNRWDKEESLYHSFGEDESSFGYLDYKTSRERKDVLNRSFSASAIGSAEGLILEKISALCDVFATLGRQKKAADLNWAFRCMTMDIITYMCFGRSVDAIHAPRFKAPIIVAMDASLPVFVAFKHSSLYKNMIMKCPPALSKVLSPPTAGLVDLQLILQRQIKDIVADPSSLGNLPHNMTIYHSLMDKAKTDHVPSAQSLYDEAQALMFAGADTVGNTIMVAMFHLLKQPLLMGNMKKDLIQAWPDSNSACPSSKVLEGLPYLTAVIKEALRMNSGVVSGLPRVVPAAGAKIAGHTIPAGTTVSIGSTFVHCNAGIFSEPNLFRPQRWLEDKSRSLDKWLVAFSRGPRSCLGINLAWCELRFTLAIIVRKFDFKLDPSSPSQLAFRECFLPDYGDRHVLAYMSEAKE